MAYDSVFTAPGAAWTQPAAEDITSAVKVQNLGNEAFAVYATAGAAPAGGPETVGATTLEPGEGLQGFLDDLFLVAAPTRLWLYGWNGISASIQYL
ncbi:hypothetical protein [Marinovum sp.]|uniref:hypothetical protein n=1 Tax=Marinovum sp. TaxID=2024839 RepID=UPI002B270A73|nr:hypothetical protein [Marinovum sp.]